MKINRHFVRRELRNTLSLDRHGFAAYSTPTNAKRAFGVDSDSHCEATRAFGVDSDSHCEATRANVIQGMDLVYSQTKSGVDSCELHS